ncbi:hypothetical protein BAR1_06820 [Profundibacter amoris]|uniref:SD-repeat containing protein B domain-containing protein n=1 Tax=Profundibacter amoris TaxID=2171755 RepID=A0A347UFN9_9RHOB|nr:hypothetical protein BAR1_06820 [Profundibacter amoris]
MYPLRQNWDSSSGKVNISAYLFNDLNENGQYDIGDRAMADIVVSLSRNGMPISVARTNLNGFANFRASTTHEDSPLSQAGEYEFTAYLPRGWRNTTDNQTQQATLIEIPGSPAGVGLQEMLTPIGMARNKFLRGTYRGDKDGHILLQQDGKTLETINLTPGEQFIWRIQRGNYELITNGQSRPVVVGDYPVDVGLIGVEHSQGDRAYTIDFEGQAPTGLKKAPNGYGGLNWFNLNIMRANMGNGNIGYANGTTSGNHILYTSSGHPARIYAYTPFSLLSVNLTAAWPKSEGEEVILSFYRGDQLIQTDAVGLSAYSPVNYQPMIPDITRIEISTRHYWQMLMDDLTVSTTP